MDEVYWVSRRPHGYWQEYHPNLIPRVGISGEVVSQEPVWPLVVTKILQHTASQCTCLRPRNTTRPRDLEIHKQFPVPLHFGIWICEPYTKHMSYSHITAWTKPCTQRKKKTEPSVKKQELTKQIVSSVYTLKECLVSHCWTSQKKNHNSLHPFICRVSKKDLYVFKSNERNLRIWATKTHDETNLR